MIAQLEEGLQPDKEAGIGGFNARMVPLKEDDIHDGALGVPVGFPALLG